MAASEAPTAAAPTPAPPSPTDGQARSHRTLVPTLLIIATLVGTLAGFAVWVHRQALNTDNWVATSGKLLANHQINTALSAYAVDQIFSSTDVAGALQQRLPKPIQGLAGPAASGLREVADRVAPDLIATPRVQSAWESANRVAHKQLLRVLNGGGPNVSTQNGEVTLNLHNLITEIAGGLGLQSQLAAARSKLQGSGGAAAKAAAQQKLGITVPSDAGQLVIMRSNELKTAQNVTEAVKGLAIVLPALAVILFALAVWLAHGWRRRALRAAGWCLVVIGLLLLIIRRVGGNQVVDALVKVPSNQPAVHEAWNIATSLLYGIAVALIVYGIVTALAAWLAGPTRPARFLRRSMAPTLRDEPAAAYGVVAALLLLAIVWAPAPAFRQVVWILLFAALLGLGVSVLRRQTAIEFPDARRGDTMHDLRARWQAARARRSSDGVAGNRLAEMERLAALHDRGALTDAEFATAKTQLMNGT